MLAFLSLSFSCPKIASWWKKVWWLLIKLLSGALDGGVDGEGEDEEDEAVEDAQDGQATVLWVVLRAWKYELEISLSTVDFLEGTNPVCIIIIALFLSCILDVYWCSGLLIIPNTAEPVITSVIGYSTHSQQHIFRKVRSRNFIVNQSQQQEVNGRAVYFCCHEKYTKPLSANHWTTEWWPCSIFQRKELQAAWQLELEVGNIICLKRKHFS